MRPLALVLPLLATTLLAGPAHADPPVSAMSPEAFEAYSTGKTLAYSQDGVIWGRETYLPGRRVLWRAVGEDCKMGHWWDEDQAVCFSYDDGTSSQCWAFTTSATGLTALFLGEPDARPAQVTEETSAVPCPGPEIGS